MTTSTTSTNHRSQVSPIATPPTPLPSHQSPAPSPTSNNKSQISNERMTNYAKNNPGAQLLNTTMATIVGHMATVLETNTQVPPAKTKPLATKTLPPVPTPWVAVRPTNPAPLDSKINHRLVSTLIPPLPFTAIADTGTTGHFLQKASSPDTTAPPIQVHMPNGQHIQSIGTTNIDWPTLPSTATKAHILPDLNPHSQVSIGVLCNHDCTATFNKHAVTIHRHNQPILTGPRLPNGLWSLPLHPNQTQHHANTLFTPQTQPKMVQWLHAAAFSPSTSTFLDAIQRNFLQLGPASPLTSSDATFHHPKPP